MKQQSLATAGFMLATKRTRKRVFLDELNLVVPWSELVGLIRPHALAGKTGLPPFAVETMLHIHSMQQWLALSDPAMEEALHDVPLYCQVARLDPGMSRLPDESTILRFRHLLEELGLNLHVMAAPSSTQNKDDERAPDMHQTKKGNQWHFGMKAHIGVDANVNDFTQGHDLLQGKETVMSADEGGQVPTDSPRLRG